jgi:hypothetical protein
MIVALYVREAVGVVAAVCRATGEAAIAGSPISFRPGRIMIIT